VQHSARDGALSELRPYQRAGLHIFGPEVLRIIAVTSALDIIIDDHELPPVTPRLRRRIERDFPEPPYLADEIVDIVSHVGPSERIQAALVIGAAGDRERLVAAVEVHFRDGGWQETLIGGGLDGLDWPQKLDAALGPSTFDAHISDAMKERGLRSP
jgi:hypothetical protein